MSWKLTLSTMKMSDARLIETDNFGFEFLSQLAERESWRKEIHRPIYHIHKWWANRLGSVFRGILLGSILSKDADLREAFYSMHSFPDMTVLDPFMGSGTTLGEAHKLGLAALGCDINPVAAESVRVALGPMDEQKLKDEFQRLSAGIGKEIRRLYRSTNSEGHACDVLYYFWVMQVLCPLCSSLVDLFPSRVIARNAYPERKPEVQVLCPSCGSISPDIVGKKTTECHSCGLEFAPEDGNANGSKATCPGCRSTFSIANAIAKEGQKPRFRLYGKLVLTEDHKKEYLSATASDLADYGKCSERLKEEEREGRLILPELALESGYNTKQAIGYGFRRWRDFFNDRQLLSLGWLNRAIADISDQDVRDAFLILFSGVLEFNNMFASYKGEGTGAVRHMFAHHILKPERTPIEANVWGTVKSSGAFSSLFRTRLLRAIEYRLKPTEVNGMSGARGVVCSDPFSGKVEVEWPKDSVFRPRVIHLSCGDSSTTGLCDGSVDLVITDPPFFDNVHYSELADFFYSWQQLVPRGFIAGRQSTRSLSEVQHSDPDVFANKLMTVFQECHRVLKDDGLMVFTYHQSRAEGWLSVAYAVLKSGFVVVNSQPVKSEMSAATPKSQAAEPIQLDAVIVCRKGCFGESDPPSYANALDVARDKMIRLQSSGFTLSQNDRKTVLYGQLLTTARSAKDVEAISSVVKSALASMKSPQHSCKNRR